MKRILGILITLTMLVSLAACEAKEKSIVQDDSPVTMLISLGNGESYYRALAAMLKQDLGIEVEFVYQISRDTSDMIRMYFAHQNLPADMIFTSSKTDDALLQDCCVDLLSRSSVTSMFTPTTIQECTTPTGAIYQLPISSRLIGITYNETLLQERGWKVPETFADMVELKNQCEQAGIPFAVTDSFATGHGFNWLFHLMGSEWLSTPEGTEWLEGFQNGTTSIAAFQEKCDYFRKWTEAGLWGRLYHTDWSGSEVFRQTRALFWYGLVNSCAGYEGLQYDEAGNATGIQLHDTYKSIPWISENGSNNCYTYYDNCWVYVNKALEAPEKADKLQKVLQIIEYMTSDKATQLISDIAKDTYVPINQYEMGADRLYAAYHEQIKNGFVQPWYYNTFDIDSIVYTGGTVNAYLAGKGSYDDIFVMLDKYNQKKRNAEMEILADFPEGLGFEDTAKLVAISGAEALNQTLAENGIAERVQVTIAPYTPEANQMQPWKSASVCNSIIHQGQMDAAMSLMIFPPDAVFPVGIYMTGAEIKELVAQGFNPADWFIDAETGKSTFDAAHYGAYPYVCLVQGHIELVDNQEYLVALCDRYITSEAYTAFREAGKVLTGFDQPHELNEGLQQFAAAHPQITPEDVAW